MQGAGAAIEWPTSGTGPQGTWQSPGYRPATSRAGAAIVFVALTAIGYAVQSIVSFMGFGVLEAAADGTLTDAQAAGYDALSSAVALITSFVYIASVVAFLRWFSRMVDNVPPLTGWIPRRSPREAIGWWFVPFANLWIPFSIARDALRRLDPTGRSWAARVLATWWLLYLAGNIISSLSTQLGRRMETLDEIRTALVVSLAAGIMLTVAGWCLVIVIRGADEISRGRAAALEIGRTGAPEWPAVAYAAAQAFEAQAFEAQEDGAVPAAWIKPVATDSSVASGDGPMLPPPPPPA